MHHGDFQLLRLINHQYNIKEAFASPTYISCTIHYKSKGTTVFQKRNFNLINMQSSTVICLALVCFAAAFMSAAAQAEESSFENLDQYEGIFYLT